MTTKYKIIMSNCCGIPALEHEFSFEINNMPIAIYAPNGLMKTSFARSFKDIYSKQTPKDIVYLERQTNFQLLDQDDAEVSGDAVFVIDSINEKFASARCPLCWPEKTLKKNMIMCLTP